MPDLTTYLTRQQVRDALGVSDKTIQRLQRKGSLTPYPLERYGEQTIFVYPPREVEKLRKLTNQQTAGPAPTQPEPPKGQEMVHQPRTPKLPTIGIEHKWFLTIPEVRAVTGLPLFVIQAAIQDGALPLQRFNRFKRVKQSDLTKWVEQLL